MECYVRIAINVCAENCDTHYFSVGSVRASAEGSQARCLSPARITICGTDVVPTRLLFKRRHVRSVNGLRNHVAVRRGIPIHINHGSCYNEVRIRNRFLSAGWSNRQHRKSNGRDKDSARTSMQALKHRASLPPLHKCSVEGPHVLHVRPAATKDRSRADRCSSRASKRMAMDGPKVC